MLRFQFKLNIKILKNQTAPSHLLAPEELFLLSPFLLFLLPPLLLPPLTLLLFLTLRPEFSVSPFLLELNDIKKNLAATLQSDC